MNHDQMEELYEDILAYAISKAFVQEIESAKAFFVKEEDESDFVGFDEWYVFHYVLKKQNTTVVSAYKRAFPEKDIAAIDLSYRSIFEVTQKSEKTYLKDIFTGRDLEVVSPIQTTDALVSVRVVPLAEGYVILGEVHYIEAVYKDVVKKYMFDQYNQYAIEKGAVTFESFLQDQGHLIFKLLLIADALYETTHEEEGLELYQTTYAYNLPVDDLLEVLMTLDFTLVPDDEDPLLYRVVIDNEIYAEIEIEPRIFQVLCNNAHHLSKMNTLIKSILNDKIVFLKTETHTIESLIT